MEEVRRNVFSLKSADGSPRFSVIPKVVKAGLVLAQMNAESERSLSVNARIVTKERGNLGEKTIVGLGAVKDAVRFSDPTDALVRAARSAHCHYRQVLEEEEAEEKWRKAEKAKKADEEARRKTD